MYRYLTLLFLVLALGITGCGRKTETNAPSDMERTPPGETTDEAMPSPESESKSESEPGDNYAGGAAMGETSEIEVCTDGWFTWVNQKVMAMPGSQLSEMYPNGLPEVASDEWFLAIDKLTGGDGAHGPDGGSDEWCSMIEQRLDAQSP